ncbi:hypothetical protein B0H11DRAFT_1984228 [Mycena galericulata]|nr:hypothetical protein B0H11DRAFT_1984228 [Mycena galericulata]
MAANTNSQTKTSSSAGIGQKLKGGVHVAKGLGDSVRGTTFGALDAVEHRDSSVNDEIARKGRMEIEQGIAMIKGQPFDPASGTQNTTNSTGPGQTGWGSGINGANNNATANATGFPAPRGQEYAQNSTANNTKSDLGRGPNAYSTNNNGPGESLQGWGSGINGANPEATTNSTGFPPPKGQEYAQNSTTAGQGAMNVDRPPQYPTPGGPPPQDYKGGMSHSNPTQLGNRPTTGAPVGEQDYQQRQGADQVPQ